MWFSCFPVLTGSAEAQLIWGGIVKHLLTAYFISNTSAKKYQNQFMCVKDIASERWDVFFETRCTIITISGIFLTLNAITSSQLPHFLPNEIINKMSYRQQKLALPPHHNHFTALFPGPRGWACARRELLDFMVQGKINRGRHTDHLAGRHSIRTNQVSTSTIPHILQAGCRSCCPTNSVKARKDQRIRIREKTLEFSSAVLPAPSPYRTVSVP